MCGEIKVYTKIPKEMLKKCWFFRFWHPAFVFFFIGCYQRAFKEERLHHWHPHPPNHPECQVQGRGSRVRGQLPGMEEDQPGYRQVSSLTQFFLACISFLKIIHLPWGLWCFSINDNPGEHCSFLLLPAAPWPGLGVGPLKGVLSWHCALLWALNLALLLELLRY